MITIKINNNFEDFKNIKETNNCNGCIFEEYYTHYDSDREYICTRCKLIKDTKKPDDCPIISITEE